MATLVTSGASWLVWIHLDDACDVKTLEDSAGGLTRLLYLQGNMPQTELGECGTIFTLQTITIPKK